MAQKKYDPFKNLKLDPYEQELNNAIERGEFQEVDNLEKMKKEAKKLAQNTIALRKNKNINLRLSETTLIKFKVRAAQEGMPYQTLAASVLHKYAHGMLKSV